MPWPIRRRRRRDDATGAGSSSATDGPGSTSSESSLSAASIASSPERRASRERVPPPARSSDGSRSTTTGAGGDSRSARTSASRRCSRASISFSSRTARARSSPSRTTSSDATSMADGELVGARGGLRQLVARRVELCLELGRLRLPPSRRRLGPFELLHRAALGIALVVGGDAIGLGVDQRLVLVLPPVGPREPQPGAAPDLLGTGRFGHPGPELVVTLDGDAARRARRERGGGGSGGRAACRRARG